MYVCNYSVYLLPNVIGQQSTYVFEWVIQKHMSILYYNGYSRRRSSFMTCEAECVFGNFNELKSNSDFKLRLKYNDLLKYRCLKFELEYRRYIPSTVTCKNSQQQLFDKTITVYTSERITLQYDIIINTIVYRQTRLWNFLIYERDSLPLPLFPNDFLPGQSRVNKSIGAHIKRRNRWSDHD